jgi:hypothetical protein
LDIKTALLNFAIGNVRSCFVYSGKRLVCRRQGRLRNERRKEKAETVLRRKVDESRDRNRPLKVFVSERERADIETRAGATSLSVSAYLRNLGLGFQPHSTLDQEAILALLKVNADQGRLGGLFKLWLSGQSAAAVETMEIRRLLAAIEEGQLKLKALIGRLPG